MGNIDELKKHIDDIINESVSKARRENDVKYKAIIIDNNFLFAIKTKYKLVRIKIERRLLKSLPINFGLSVHVVYPDPMKDDYDVWMASKFNLFEIGNIIDTHYSIMKWNVFGKDYVIRTFQFGSKYLNPVALKATSIDDYDGKSHLDLMIKNGYDYRKRYNHPWEVYSEAYEKAYEKPVMKAEDYETISNC